MSKFIQPRVVKYTFVNLDQMIIDVCEEFDEKHGIEIIVSSNEAQDVIFRLMTTGKFRPCMLDYSHTSLGDYDSEYIISLCHCKDGEIWVEKALSDGGEYKSWYSSSTNIVFMSNNVSDKLYSKYENEGHRIVYYNIED